MLRGLQYIRVSDEEQAIEGYSITAQKSLLDRRFAEWGAQVVGVYIDDGYSAKDMRRPDLQRMMKDLETVRPDFIAFWKLDRWTRKGRDWNIMKDTLKKYGIELRSAIGENLEDDTAAKRFSVGLNVLLAEFEREQVSERVHFVMSERQIAGLRNGAKPPYGYDLVDGKLVINHAQAEVVRKIYRMYTTELIGIRSIAVNLNRDPERPDDRKWNYTSVRGVLTNPAYVGDLRWNYRKASGKRTGKEMITQNTHEPIIDREVFDRINEEVAGRAKGGKTVVADHVFSGVLRCARCGYAMTGFSAKKRDGRHKYYRCVGRAQFGTCNLPIFRADKVEEALLTALDYDSEQLRKLIDISVDTKRKDRESIRLRLLSELETIKKRKKKWQLAYADDAISLEELKERTSEDSAREAEIAIELQKAPEAPRTRWTKEELLHQVTRLLEVWQDAEDREKKAFVRELFESITINGKTEHAHGAPGKFAEPIVVDFQLKE